LAWLVIMPERQCKYSPEPAPESQHRLAEVRDWNGKRCLLGSLRRTVMEDDCRHTYGFDRADV